MDSHRHVITAVVVLVLLTSTLWMAAYVYIAGETAEGVVTERHEAFEMGHGDFCKHAFTIAYKFQPPGAVRPRIGEHPVDASLFHRLRPGSRVAVRYTTLPVVEGVVGIGSFLADSTWDSRHTVEVGSGSRSAEFAGVIAAALLGFVAFRRKSWLLGWIAALLGSVIASAVLVGGCVVFPLLLCLCIAKPRKGFVWLFLATLPLTVALLYWRIPKSAPLPPGPSREADAVVRRIHLVDQLWTDDEGGESIRHPFLMLDLEYTPAGSDEPFHVLDRIDRGSVPDLREGAKVRIRYTPAEPGAARIVGATRDYSRAILIELLSDTFKYGAALTLMFGVIFVIGEVARRFFARLSRLQVPEDAINRISGLPQDDPRRKAIETVLRAKARAENPPKETL